MRMMRMMRIIRMTYCPILLSECTIEAGLCRHEYRFVDDMRLVILSESVVIKDTVPMYL